MVATGSLLQNVSVQFGITPSPQLFLGIMVNETNMIPTLGAFSLENLEGI